VPENILIQEAIMGINNKSGGAKWTKKVIFNEKVKKIY
jgi:hypothetical protein